MGVIAVIAYKRLATRPRWQAYHLHGRYLPAEHVRALLPQFRRWVDYVRPILSEGKLVGLWVSNRMSTRRWHRLRDLAEAFLVSSAEPPQPSAAPAKDDAGQARHFSLSRLGLYIPRERVDLLLPVLKQLGNIELTCDEDLNGEGLIIPAGRSLNGLYAALEIAVEPITDDPREEVSPSRRRHLHELLREALSDLD